MRQVMLLLIVIAILCYCMSDSAEGRVIGLAYGYGVAEKEQGLRTARCDGLRFGVVLLPWELCQKALSLLDEGKAGDDIRLLAPSLARLLESEDREPRGQPPDTLLAVQPRLSKPVKVYVLAYSFAEDSHERIDVKIKELEPVRKRLLESWAGQYRVLDVKSGAFDQPDYRYPAIPYYQTFSSRIHEFRCLNRFNTILPDVIGSADRILDNAGVKAWEYTASNRMYDTTVLIRYSPLYGATSVVSYPSDPKSKNNICVDKLIAAYDSAGKVPVELLAAPRALQRSRPLCRWYYALGGAAVVCAVFGIGWLYRRRTRRK